jgi:HPt (histidine-containing phosphotransfer) domain-containing protein
MHEIEKNDNNLNTLLVEKDMAQFSVAARGLKSSLINIGAMEFASEALALEEAADAENSDFCAENLPLFLEELNELYGKLKEAFSVICYGPKPVEFPSELMRKIA